VRILVTGDIHGVWSSMNVLINRKHPDLVIQCGDFGFFPNERVDAVYRRAPRGDELRRKVYAFNPRGRLRNRVDDRLIPVHWCDGNHEDHETLKALVAAGETEVAPQVFYQPRGSTLTLPDGRTVLFAGGAKSVDWKVRDDWSPLETLTLEDLEAFPDGEAKVDILVSHTAPAFLTEAEKGPNRFEQPGYYDYSPDISRAMLDVVWERYRPKHWFFGHFHRFIEVEKNGTRFTGLSRAGGQGRWWTWLDEEDV